MPLCFILHMSLIFTMRMWPICWETPCLYVSTSTTPPLTTTSGSLAGAYRLGVGGVNMRCATAIRPTRRAFALGWKNIWLEERLLTDLPRKCADSAQTIHYGATGTRCRLVTQQIGPDASKGQCSWRIIKRVKTIDGLCLLKTHGMMNMCLQEADYPFAKTSAILLDSFDYDDPAQGGCPAIA